MATILPIILVFGVSLALIVAGHWAPWRKALGRDLRRTEAYAYGVLVILVPSLGVLAAAWQLWAVGVVLAGAAGAGLGTYGAYAADWVIELYHELADTRDRAAYADANELPADPGD
jgi:hypothetical protein